MTKEQFVKRYNKIMKKDGIIEINCNGEGYLITATYRYDYQGYELELRIELQDECFDIYQGDSHVVEIAYSELEEEDVY